MVMVVWLACARPATTERAIPDGWTTWTDSSGRITASFPGTGDPSGTVRLPPARGRWPRTLGPISVVRSDVAPDCAAGRFPPVDLEAFGQVAGEVRGFATGQGCRFSMLDGGVGSYEETTVFVVPLGGGDWGVMTAQVRYSDLRRTEGCTDDTGALTPTCAADQYDRARDGALFEQIADTLR